MGASLSMHTTLSYYRSGRLLSIATTGVSGEELARTTYEYDPHEHLVTTTDGRTGTVTTYDYDAADQVIAILPAAFGDIPAQRPSFVRDGMGRVIQIVFPDGGRLTNEFTHQGLLHRTFGAHTYPGVFEYDSQGRATNLVTWPAAGTANTRWVYDPKHGRLAAKLYADQTGTQYTYTKAGRLESSTAARGLTTTYTYNPAGELASTTGSSESPRIELANFD